MGSTVSIERRPDPKAELGYVCPECKAWSQIALWRETEVGCEDCGEHGALECPACEERIHTVFTAFEDADQFLLRLSIKARADADEVAILQGFLKAADDRLREAKAEAAAARREADGRLRAAQAEASTMRAAWLRAVGDRLLFRPDLVTALFETTLDMRLHLDELANEDAVCLHAEMVAEYGPFTPSLIEEDA